MSSGIWTRCAGASEIRHLERMPFRVVESQHQVSTRKLVDTVEEQALLESLIDGVKPPDPTGGRLHYLLSTPFRYPPLPHGSRFGTRAERGVWYGSESLTTAFAEAAYYRLLFLEGTAADLAPLATQLTTFAARVRTARGVDLVAPPFDAFAGVIAARAGYADTQMLGSAMRDAAVEAFRYPSARDEGGVNVGVFTWRIFTRLRPRGLREWHCTATRERVEMVERDWFRETSCTFAREQFLVNGALPAPAP
jgi:hypothetical protein